MSSTEWQKQVLTFAENNESRAQKWILELEHHGITSMKSLELRAKGTRWSITLEEIQDHGLVSVLENWAEENIPKSKFSLLV